MKAHYPSEEDFDFRPKIVKSKPKPRFQSAAPARLRIAVGSYYRMQGMRIATSNGLKGLRRDYKSYSKAEYELDETSLVQPLAEQEEAFGRLITGMIKNVAIAQWVISTVKGMAGVLTAQLIALLGDISLYPTLAKLWSYAGLRPDQRRQQGVKSNWNADLKRLMYNISVSLLKSGGYYAGFYEFYRQKVDGHAQHFYDLIFARLGEGHKVVERLQAEFDLDRQIREHNQREKTLAKLENRKPKGLRIMSWVRFQSATLDAAIELGMPRPKRRDFAALTAGIRFLTEKLGLVSRGRVEGGGEAIFLKTPAITPAHRHARALRKMQKVFLEHVFMKWRSLAGLPETKPWIFTVGGHDEINYVLPPTGKDDQFDPNRCIQQLRATGS